MRNHRLYKLPSSQHGDSASAWVDQTVVAMRPDALELREIRFAIACAIVIVPEVRRHAGKRLRTHKVTAVVKNRLT